MDEQRNAVVIEDDADIRQLLVIVLASRGFTVHEAVTGAEGERLVETVDPQLVTLDLNLPDSDGIDVCAHLRAKPYSPRHLGAYLDGVFPRASAA